MTPPSLRALRVACAACSARASARPSRLAILISALLSIRRGDPPAPPRARGGFPPPRTPGGLGQRPEYLGLRGQRGRADELRDRLGRSRDGRHPHGRRETELGAFSQLPFGKRDRIPADERLHRGQRRLGQHHHRPARADQGGRVQPAAQRLFGGAQAGTAK